MTEKKQKKPRVAKVPTELNMQMELFCTEYMKDMNATQAAIRAGYSEKSARQQACRLCSYPVVQDRLQALFQEKQTNLQMQSQDLIAELIMSNSYDMLQIFDPITRCLKPFDQWPLIVRTELVQSFKVFEKFEKVRGEDGKMTREKVGEIIEVKLVDRLRVKELIGKHLGTWKEKVEIDLSDPVQDLWRQISGKSFTPKDS